MRTVSIAGLAEAAELFKGLDLDARAQVEEGCQIKKGTVVMTIHGPLKAILLGERTALNFIMRMSGIATVTSKILWDCRRMNKNVQSGRDQEDHSRIPFLREESRHTGRGRPAP